MKKTDPSHHIAPDIRAAIHAFLEACQTEARPFAIEEALGAVRAVFPDLDISDADLVDAIASEASTAGFDIDYDVNKSPREIKRRGLERWDNEGGAIGKNAPEANSRK